MKKIMRECKCGGSMVKCLVNVSVAAASGAYKGAFVVDKLLALWVCIDPHCQMVVGEFAE